MPTEEGSPGASSVPSVDTVLVILPTYDEAGTLAEVAGRLQNAVPNVSILIIDDASRDGTGLLADNLAATEPRIYVLHRAGKLGLGTAYLEGFAWAVAREFDWIVQMDADGSHLPEQLPSLLAAARAGAGLVIGARWIDWRQRRWVALVPPSYLPNRNRRGEDRPAFEAARHHERLPRVGPHLGGPPSGRRNRSSGVRVSG